MTDDNYTRRAMDHIASYKAPKEKPIHRVYLDHGKPCWMCSRSLFQLKQGKHRGSYVAALVLGEDGNFHICHIECVRNPERSAMKEYKEKG